MINNDNVDRELRRLKNTSQPVINVDGVKTKNISEGELKFTKTNSNLILNKKHNGLLWQSKFYKDGNEIVDKNLTVKNNLNVKGTLEINGNVIKFNNLPTSDPTNAGQLWNDSGTLKISSG